MRLDQYERQQDDWQARDDATEQLRETAMAQLEEAEREIDLWLEAIDELDEPTPRPGLRLA